MIVAATFAPVLSIAITRLLFAAVLLITPSKNLRSATELHWPESTVNTIIPL
jgi:hypothetical protein